MGLSSSNITFGAGVSYGNTNLAVSWLDSNTVTKALNVVETAQSVQFSYPDKHTVSVDRNTGLLREESTLSDNTYASRKLVLKNFAKLQNSMPYALLIPQFDNIKFEETSSKLFSDQMAQSFITLVGQQLTTITNFDEILRTNSVRFATATRELARAMVRDKVKAQVTQKSAVKFRKKVLIPAYKSSFLQDPPVDVRDLSFTNVLVYATSVFETNANMLVPSEAFTLIKKEIYDTQHFISQLPKGAQKPFVKIYNIVIPAVVEGVMLEYWTATMSRIGAQNLPELNPDLAKAYVKRGVAEQTSGDLTNAVHDFQQALILQPKDSAIKKKLDGATTQLNQSSSKTPPDQ